MAQFVDVFQIKKLSAETQRAQRKPFPSSLRILGGLSASCVEGKYVKIVINA
jgi:hypothetical protein